MLELKNVTLCSVDTRTPQLALQALQRSMQEIRYGEVIMFTHGAEKLAEAATALGVRLVDVGDIRTIEQYSAFILRGLAEWIKTDFALVTQWDGFVLNASAWREEFLAYDYIGALWREFSGALAVGNGGFSLRSSRLLHAMGDPDVNISHPEDLCICVRNRAHLERAHGIRFAPPELAAIFSYEHIRPTVPTFGFHGIFNLAEALTPEDMLAFTRDMTVDMAFGAGARGLARTLVYQGQYQAARELLNKRIAAGDRRWRTLSLWLRMWLRQQLRLKAVQG
jgi:Protein of unknown function (DUF5672)